MARSASPQWTYPPEFHKSEPTIPDVWFLSKPKCLFCLLCSYKTPLFNSKHVPSVQVVHIFQESYSYQVSSWLILELCLQQSKYCLHWEPSRLKVLLLLYLSQKSPFIKPPKGNFTLFTPLSASAVWAEISDYEWSFFMTYLSSLHFRSFRHILKSWHTRNTFNSVKKKLPVVLMQGL